MHYRKLDGKDKYKSLRILEAFMLAINHPRWAPDNLEELILLAQDRTAFDSALTREDFLEVLNQPLMKTLEVIYAGKEEAANQQKETNDFASFDASRREHSRCSSE